MNSTQQPDAARPTASLQPIDRAAFGEAQARHLLWRAGFGGTPAQVRLVAEWGPEKAVDHLLGGDTPRDAGKGHAGDDAVTADLFKSDIMRPPSPEEARIIQQARRAQDEDTLAKVRAARMERERDDRRQMREIQRWWLTRMVETPRPLVEKMTLFWHGHFATNYRTIEDSYHMFVQNQLFRSEALGSFARLLGGIIRDPAMLAYLDNNDSRKDRPNENLAREIMELFALGVGNYTERDIKEGARALTGYTFEDDRFVFRNRNHDAGNKSILGKSGTHDGEDFVKIILGRPACARFVARKLYQFFVADIPPLDATDNDKALGEPAKGVINDLAGALRGADYQLRPVLRRLFLSRHFYDPAVVGQQIKSPVQLVVGAARSLGAPVRDLGVMLDAADLMGQNIFFPPSVKGWNGGRSWINTSTLYVRQNVLAFMLTGKRPQGFDPLAEREAFDPAPLLEGLDTEARKDPARVAERLLTVAIGSAPSDAVDALTAYAARAPGRSEREIITGMLLIVTAMPEYQLC